MAFHNPPRLNYIFPFRLLFHAEWFIIVWIFPLSEIHKNWHVALQNITVHFESIKKPITPPIKL
jgi:hypothetical protein